MKPINIYIDDANARAHLQVAQMALLQNSSLTMGVSRCCFGQDAN
jgi:hypothetical protein